jgi:hypothetical protein
MHDVFLLNEVAPGADPLEPGDIEVFPCREAVESYIEPWYVDETYLLVSGDGTRHIVEPDEPRVRLVPSGDAQDYPEPVRRLVLTYLERSEGALRHRKRLPAFGSIDFAPLSTPDLFRLALLLG